MVGAGLRVCPVFQIFGNLIFDPGGNRATLINSADLDHIAIGASLQVGIREAKTSGHFL